VSGKGEIEGKEIRLKCSKLIRPSLALFPTALRLFFAHDMRSPLSTSSLPGLGGDGHSVGSGTASLAEEVNALNEMGARGEIEWAALKALLVKVNVLDG